MKWEIGSVYLQLQDMLALFLLNVQQKTDYRLTVSGPISAHNTQMSIKLKFLAYS